MESYLSIPCGRLARGAKGVGLEFYLVEYSAELREFNTLNFSKLHPLTLQSARNVNVVHDVVN